MIYNYLFMLGMIMYGLSRATQQALIFMHRDKQDIPEWIDEPGEVHLYGWIETLSLILSIFSLSYYVFNVSYWFILAIIPAYCIYFLPYALLFNKMRCRKWFLPNQMYRFTIFDKEFKTKLPNKLLAATLFIAGCAFAIFGL